MAKTGEREAVLEILEKVRENGTYSHIAVKEVLDRCEREGMDRQQRAFVKRLAEGVIERRIELDSVIRRFTKKGTRIKPAIREILRMGVFQILYMDSVPDSAACNEAVKLAKAGGRREAAGFVNGVLRNVAREHAAEKKQRQNAPAGTGEEQDNSIGELSRRYSMPEWIVRSFRDEFGPIVTRMMLKSMLEERPMTVRFKTDRISPLTIIESLKSQGVKVRRAPYLPYAYIISEYNYLPSLTAFRNGWIFPQDVSSMLVSEVAAPVKGEYVIDMCAAPGGKSLHIADKMGNFGEVEARDLSEDKVALIRENVRRAGIINVKPVQMDALVYDAASEEKADIVLCDLPCSGLGVISRKSDIKYRVTPEKISSLVELQRMILRNAAAYVRPGGRLIFSTCTLGHRENEDNVAWFTQHFPFKTESLNPYLPRALWRLSTENGYLQMIPGVHETDGFFIARMKKKSYD